MASLEIVSFIKKLYHAYKFIIMVTVMSMVKIHKDQINISKKEIVQITVYKKLNIWIFYKEFESLQIAE